MTADQIITSAPSLPLENEANFEARMELINSLVINSRTEVAADVPMLKVGGVGFLYLRNINAVKAKQKQGKTTSLMVCVSALLRGRCFRLECDAEEPVILWVDTEQSDYDSKCIISRVAKLTELSSDYVDEHLIIINVRKFSTQERLGFILDAVNIYRPQVVIIDGVVDLIDNFNDIESSKQIVNELLRLCSTHNLAIVTVLHTNKNISDHEMRGHIGTMLAQKSSTVLECEKENDIITVKCTDSRHATMPTWSVRYDEFGNICEGDLAYAEMQAKKELEREAEREAKKAEKEEERNGIILGIVREYGGSIERKKLVEEMMTRMGKGKTVVYKSISNAINSGTIIDSDGIVCISDN